MGAEPAETATASSALAGARTTTGACRRPDAFDGVGARSDCSRQSVWAGHVALAGAQVAFGLFPIFGTLAFGPGGVSPLGLGTWRIAVGAVVLALLAAMRWDGRR